MNGFYLIFHESFKNHFIFILGLFTVLYINPTRQSFLSFFFFTLGFHKGLIFVLYLAYLLKLFFDKLGPLINCIFLLLQFYSLVVFCLHYTHSLIAVFLHEVYTRIVLSFDIRPTHESFSTLDLLRNVFFFLTTLGLITNRIFSVHQTCSRIGVSQMRSLRKNQFFVFHQVYSQILCFLNQAYTRIVFLFDVSGLLTIYFYVTLTYITIFFFFYVQTYSRIAFFFIYTLGLLTI